MTAGTAYCNSGART